MAEKKKKKKERDEEQKWAEGRKGEEKKRNQQTDSKKDKHISNIKIKSSSALPIPIAIAIPIPPPLSLPTKIIGRHNKKLTCGTYLDGVRCDKSQSHIRVSIQNRLRRNNLSSQRKL